MRPSLFLVAATLTLAAQASWFSGSSSSEPTYAHWNSKELKSWLTIHNIPVPNNNPTQAELRDLVAENWNTASAWTYKQYNTAQKAFTNLRETSFDKWDESRLREFLLEHGVVAPKGPREQLVLLAKAKYRSFTDAASSFSARASSTASTAVYGDTQYQLSKSASSVASQATSAVAQATDSAARAFDNTKDYVYSTWSENEMRKWLETRGLLKTKEQKKKDELVQLMHNAWGTVANPVYNAWSDSYLHHWLVSNHIIKSDYEKKRDDLINKMNHYYYSSTDTVYNGWSDSELRNWLVQHGIMKSDAQASRDKMLKLVEDNYLSAKDTFWHAWSDNSIRQWLIDNGYMRSDAQVKRDELVKLANEKYQEAHARTGAYLTWPDARLRSYLRRHGIDDSSIPGDRPSLLQETRIRWVQTEARAESLFQKVKDLVNSGVYKAEDVLLKLVHLLSGGWEEGKEKAEGAYTETKAETKRQGEKGWEEAKRRGSDASEWAEEKAGSIREEAGEKVKAGGENVKIGGDKIKGEL